MKISKWSVKISNSKTTTIKTSPSSSEAVDPIQLSYMKGLTNYLLNRLKKRMPPQARVPISCHNDLCVSVMMQLVQQNLSTCISYGHETSMRTEIQGTWILQTKSSWGAV